jgi:hypothetical protein
VVGLRPILVFARDFTSPRPFFRNAKAACVGNQSDDSMEVKKSAGRNI